MRVITHISFFLFLFYASACSNTEFGTNEGTGNVVYAEICYPSEEDDCQPSLGGVSGAAGAYVSTGGSEDPPSGGNPTGGLSAGGAPTGGTSPTGGVPPLVAGAAGTAGEQPDGGEISDGGFGDGGISAGGDTPNGGDVSVGGEESTGGASTGGTSPTGGVPTGGVAPTGGAPRGGASGALSQGGAGGDPGPNCDKTGLRVRVERPATTVNASLTSTSGSDLVQVCTEADDLDASPNVFECCILTDWYAGNATILLEFLVNGVSTCTSSGCQPYDIYTVWANGGESAENFGSIPKDGGTPNSPHVLTYYVPAQFQ